MRGIFNGVVAALIGCAATTSASAGDPTPSAKATPWWSHAVIYEIYPRSFQDSDGDGVGDLRGITRRLDYLQALGVDAIWVTPFFPSPNRDFGYDVSDYTSIDPRFGTMRDWDDLVRLAKAHGIRVLVDLVVNHSSSEHPWFKASRSARSDPKRDWYVWRDARADGSPPTNWKSIFGGPSWTYDTTTGQYYYHIFLPEQPDLNWANPELRAAMFGVVRFWLDHGASGFRLDATPYLFEDPAFPQDPDPDHGAPVALKPYNAQRPEGHQVLREMRAILDSYPGDRVLLGESATASIEQLRAVYGRDKDEINLPMDFLVGNMPKLEAPALKHQFDDAALKLDGLPPVFFFSNHDRSRQWSAFGDGVHDEAIARMTAALTLLEPGTALLYYGEEIGMRDIGAKMLAAAPLGPNRPKADERDRARGPMQWSEAPNAGFSTSPPWLPVDPGFAHENVGRQTKDTASLLHWYRALIGLRRTEAAFSEGAYLPLESGNANIYAFARRAADGSGALVMVNTSANEQGFHLSGWPDGPPKLGRTLLSNATATNSAARGRIGAYGTLVVSAHFTR